jgi:hypothetical protein
MNEHNREQKEADEGSQLTRDALLAEVLNQIEEVLGYEI